MSDKKTRRAVLGSLGLAGGAFLLGGMTKALAEEKEAEKSGQPGLEFWTYRKLDPKPVADQAYTLYREGSCMYAVCGSIVGALAEKYGQPYASFPFGMMRYGHGGIGGWGTTCGTLNGAAAVFGLFVEKKKTCDLLTGDLFNWYRKTELPNYVPEGKEKILTCKPGAVLCHVSSSLWCKIAEKPMKSPERKERCARLTASVAAKTVELMNDYLDAKVPTKHDAEEFDFHSDAISKMRCGMCHEME